MRGGIEVNDKETDIRTANLRKCKVNPKHLTEIESVNDTSSIKR